MGHTCYAPKETNHYHTPEVARITGIPFRTLDYWARRGIFGPSIAPARGTGTERLYSFDDLVALVAIARVPASDAAIRRLIGSRCRINPKGSIELKISDYVKLILDLDGIRRFVRYRVEEARP